MEARQLAAQLLEMIARRHTQILVAGRVVHHLELAKGAAFELRRDIPRLDVFEEERSQPFIPKAHNHKGNSVLSKCTTLWVFTPGRRCFQALEWSAANKQLIPCLPAGGGIAIQPSSAGTNVLLDRGCGGSAPPLPTISMT
jgi:hypothetical protein